MKSHFMRYEKLTPVEQCLHFHDLCQSAIKFSHVYGITNVGREELKHRKAYWAVKFYGLQKEQY